MLPKGNASGASFVIMDKGSTESNACASPITTNFSRVKLSTIIFSGIVNVGDVVSTTETVCVDVAKLPDESVAVYVTVVSPSGNESGASLIIEIISTESLAVDVPMSVKFPSIPVAST